MNIEVEYKDASKKIYNQTHQMTRIAFIKYLAIAGQGYAPKPQKLIRMLAMFFHYFQYMQSKEFMDNKFSEPPIQLSDPTEKGQFSNLVGKAIADFLSKQIDKSLFTVNYEAAMRLKKMKLNVSRPDLLAFNQSSMFAIEAKGYSGGHGNMTTHKAQSQTGGIPVNFSVACVSYNIYSKVQCKYYDPSNNNMVYDNILLKKLTKQYYSGLMGFLNSDFFSFREINIQGEKFYEVELSKKVVAQIYSDNELLRFSVCVDLLDYYAPRLILPIAIKDFAKYGINSQTMPFIFDMNDNDNNLFIDNDRVGLRVNW